jgi:hypothetical protein
MGLHYGSNRTAIPLHLALLWCLGISYGTETPESSPFLQHPVSRDTSNPAGNDGVAARINSIVDFREAERKAIRHIVYNKKLIIMLVNILNMLMFP